MLIKNNKGDWGLLTAYWEGYKATVGRLLSHQHHVFRSEHIS